ncbi:hypothetical protein Tco_0172477, partial [Tanacetum coccineum]
VEENIDIAEEKDEVPMKDVEMDENHNIDHSGTKEALQWSLAKDPFLVIMELNDQSSFLLHTIPSFISNEEPSLAFELSMDGGARVDVPWHVAKFFTDKEKGYKKKSLIVGAHLIGKISRSYGLMIQRSLRSVTLGLETSLLSVEKLVNLGICRYNGLGLGDMVDDLPDDGKNEVDEAVEGQDNVEGVRRMSEQYDQFYDEFGQMKLEQQRFQTWNTDHLSQLLSFRHINHTRYDGTPYSYVQNIPDLEF